MTKKQTLRINVLAAAVLSLTVGVGAAHATGQGVAKEPSRLASADQQAVSGVIIKYRSGTAASSDRSAKLSVVQSALSRAIVSTGTTASAAALAPQVERTLGTGADLVRLKSRLGGADMQKVLAELNADPAVQYAVANVRLQRSDLRAASAQPALVPNDPDYQRLQWNFHNATGGVNAQPAWDVSQGEGVVVAVLDTGIIPNVPDFGTNLLEGYDFISDKASSRRPNDGRAPGATDYGDWVETANECYNGSQPEDSSWHGTHVAGTIAEVANNGSAVAGLAYKAKVLPVRVLGKCGGTLADISDAITWASGGTVQGVPANANPAEIINMSLGGSGACDAAYQDAINGAVSRGTLVVVAAGNETDNAAKYRPSSCANVVAVGATRVTGGITYYSNYGTVVDLAAPGGGGSVDGNPNGYIWQIGTDAKKGPTGGQWIYMGKGGTSMSSPHVAAVAAMVQSALIAKGNAPLAPAALETLLKQSARRFPVTIPAATPIGSGILDAKAALDAALKEPCTENCEPEGIPLTNKVTVGGLAGAAASETVYTFQAVAGKTLSVLTYGGSGNVSVYLAQGRVPTATDHDAKSTRPGNTETVRVATPVAGTYYIKVVGEAAYNGVSILATQ